MIILDFELAILLFLLKLAQLLQQPVGDHCRLSPGGVCSRRQCRPGSLDQSCAVYRDQIRIPPSPGTIFHIRELIYRLNICHSLPSTRRACQTPRRAPPEIDEEPQFRQLQQQRGNPVNHGANQNRHSQATRIPDETSPLAEASERRPGA